MYSTVLDHSVFIIPHKHIQPFTSNFVVLAQTWPHISPDINATSTYNTKTTRTLYFTFLANRITMLCVGTNIIKSEKPLARLCAHASKGFGHLIRI